jgi:hypothetical protein
MTTTNQPTDQQQELYAALTNATNNPIAQYGLIRVYAKRLACSEGDVLAVKQMIDAAERAR